MSPYFAIKLFGVFPSPDPKALQQVHKAHFFPTQVNCRGISKEYVHILVPESTRAQAARETAKGRKPPGGVSRTRSRATTAALQREGSAAVSHEALSRQ